MANIVPDPANVRVGAGAAVSIIGAGEALTAGDFYFVSSLDNLAYKTSNTSQATAYMNGIVLAGCGIGEQAIVTTGGAAVNLGAALEDGELYVASDVAGQVMPYGDLTTGDWITWCCLGDENGEVSMFHKAVGVQKA